MHVDVAIVGGGASGLVAAIAARRGGAIVVVLEKNQKIGKKILASGNGRCNLGNEDLSLDHFVSQDLSLAGKILRQFDGTASLSFFRQLGLEYAHEDGRIYPRSKQAAAVPEVLRHELEHLGVDIVTEAAVASVVPASAGFTVTYGGGKTLHARRVILSTGGMAGPHLGCTGDGYALAKQMGHSVLEPTPSLVGLKLRSPYLKVLSGLRLHARVCIPELGLTETGEVIFTDYGISGIPVFDLTRAMRTPQGLSLQVCLVPDVESHETLVQHLRARFDILAHKAMSEALIGFLPRQLNNPLLQEAGIDPERVAGRVSKAEVDRLAETTWCWELAITGLNTWEQAQTTSGGIPLTEVDSSLESKLMKGLYFAGEVLDVHGRCGGYNLHWAWASGYVAGAHAGHVII